jgi:type IV secretion system protein VirB6
MSFQACAPISSGSEFLKSSLAYLDCAGRAIGSTGYTALSQPGSIPSQFVLTAVTLFIAWHGIRMMFGRMPHMGDAVLAVAKIGLVLMLVTSWPAVRTIFAAPAFNGPAELGAQSRLEGSQSLEDRLQQLDDGIVALTKWGTGKLDIRAGQTAAGQPAATEFSGVALTDNLALGLGRLCFLVGALISIGLLKLLVGVMISALPIFAGLLLFESSRGLFWGWLRMIFALFVASFAIPLILTAEISLIEPWLARAIEDRSAYFATPSAPTELLAISGSFLLILLGSTALIVKTCFAVDFAGLAGRVERWRQAESTTERMIDRPASASLFATRPAEISRAESLALSLGRRDQSERHLPVSAGAGPYRAPSNDLGPPDAGRSQPTAGKRRARQRMALSHAKRNNL